MRKFDKDINRPRRHFCLPIMVSPDVLTYRMGRQSMLHPGTHALTTTDSFTFRSKVDEMELGWVPLMTTEERAHRWFRPGIVFKMRSRNCDRSGEILGLIAASIESYDHEG